jgi:hypothetical protein
MLLLSLSGDNAINAPFRGFLEKTRGLSVKKIFIKDFLSKKIFRRFTPEKKGGGVSVRGVSIALSPDSTFKKGTSISHIKGGRRIFFL